MYPCNEEEFLQYAKKDTVIPVYEEFQAAFDTPLSVYLKLRKGPYSFLLESVEEGRRVGRYSFIGAEPRVIFKAKDGQVTITEDGKAEQYITTDPLLKLAELFQNYQQIKLPGLQGFTGGAVGYLGYEMIRYFEKLPAIFKEGEGLYDCVFMFMDNLVIFDHVRQMIQVVANAKVTDNPRRDYQEAIKRIEEIRIKLNRQIPLENFRTGGKEKISRPLQVKANVSPSEFETMVQKAKEYIKAGDIFQVVLSQRIEVELETDPLEIYRNLRSINPSPYMFYLDLDDLKLIGSSPEFLVKVTDQEVEVRPIAGTRPRGVDSKQEDELKKELLADEKEKAEHLMLVDLGRNDIGRVCTYGSVCVEKFMEVEKYSHVMHLVSRVKGKLAPERTNFDVLRACFPAGTVSGAPKIRAMEIIDELEPTVRGAYAGAVGYIGYNGEMDTCITIRTIIIKDNKAYIQAGAGIVADSDPAKEYQETQNKARALLKAVETAERGRSYAASY